VQFGADETQPLMQAAAFDARCCAQSHIRKAVRDILKNRGVFGEDQAIIGADRRHEAERIHAAKIGIVLQHLLRFWIDFKIARLGAGFIQGDAGCHRTGKGREVEVHGASPGVEAGVLDFYTVPHKLNAVKIFICDMVQKKKNPPEPETGAPKKRGRPRAFEPDVALGKAMDTFRDGGFAATSLDDLSEAMGINRPSLYGTFGDKRELFLKAYDRYRAEMAAKFAHAFDPKLTLRQMLEAIYATALDVYLAGDKGPRGCFTVMTATSEAMADPDSSIGAKGAGIDPAHTRQAFSGSGGNRRTAADGRCAGAVADRGLDHRGDSDPLARPGAASRIGGHRQGHGRPDLRSETLMAW
jgi:AcrR family transcriptional regulator